MKLLEIENPLLPVLCRGCEHKVNNIHGGWCHLHEDFNPKCRWYTPVLPDAPESEDK